MLQIRWYFGNHCQKGKFQRKCTLRNISCISSILNRKSSKEKKKAEIADKKEAGKSDIPEKPRRTKLVNGELFDRTGDITIGIIGGGIESAYAAVLLKQSRLVSCVNVLDVNDTLKGTILDIGHIDTAPKVKYYNKKRVKEALNDVDVVALMDEVTPDISKGDNASQFDAVHKYVRGIAEMTVQYCPTALVAVIVRPVTAILPMISEIYRCAGWWNPNKILGSVAIESMRMEATTANLLDLNPAFLSVPMIAGADSCTVVPLLSCARPTNHFTSDTIQIISNLNILPPRWFCRKMTYAQEQREFLTYCLRTADKEIATTEIKVPTLSTGAAAAKFLLTLAGGLSGFKNVVGCAYVRSNILPGCRFFTTELQFGPNGVQKNFGLPKVSSAEISLIEQAIPFINENVEMGLMSLHE